MSKTSEELVQFKRRLEVDHDALSNLSGRIEDRNLSGRIEDRGGGDSALANLMGLLYVGDSIRYAAELIGDALNRLPINPGPI